MQRELESARLTVVPWDTPFEILKGTYTRHRFAPHLHDTFALGAIEAGASKIRYRDRMVSQRAGDVVVIPAREVHTGETDGPQGWSYRMLYLPEDVLAGFTVAEDLTFDGPSIADPELARRIVELHALLDAGTDRLRGQTALVDVLQMLCTRHAGGSVDRSRDARPSATLCLVRDYLEAHFAKADAFDITRDTGKSIAFGAGPHFCAGAAASLRPARPRIQSTTWPALSPSATIAARSITLPPEGCGRARRATMARMAVSSTVVIGPARRRPATRRSSRRGSAHGPRARR